MFHSSIQYLKCSNNIFIKLRDTILSITHDDFFVLLLSADDVRSEFKKFGPIADVWIARQPPGFAFVEVNNVKIEEDDLCKRSSQDCVLEWQIKLC